MNGLRDLLRLFHRPQPTPAYEPARDERVAQMQRAAAQERERAATIREMRRTGNFLTDRLLPRPAVDEDKQEEGQGK